MTRPATRPARGGLLTKVLPPFVVFGALLGVWYLSSNLSYDNRIEQNQMQPYPHDVVRKGYLISRNLSEMLRSLWQTAQVALIGLALAMLIGVFLAVLMSLAKTLERSLFPYAVVLQTVPIVAINSGYCFAGNAALIPIYALNPFLIRSVI